MNGPSYFFQKIWHITLHKIIQNVHFRKYLGFLVMAALAEGNEETREKEMRKLTQ